MLVKCYYRSDFNTKNDMSSHYSPFWLQLLGSFKVLVGFCLLLWLLGWLVGGWMVGGLEGAWLVVWLAVDW